MLFGTQRSWFVRPERSSKTTAQVKIFTFCSCLGLLPNNGSNNVTNSNCFNCCVLKLI
jgi:hypothetical protein